MRWGWRGERSLGWRSCRVSSFRRARSCHITRIGPCILIDWLHFLGLLIEQPIGLRLATQGLWELQSSRRKHSKIWSSARLEIARYEVVKGVWLFRIDLGLQMIQILSILLIIDLGLIRHYLNRNGMGRGRRIESRCSVSTRSTSTIKFNGFNIWHIRSPWTRSVCRRRINWDSLLFLLLFSNQKSPASSIK